MSERPRPIFDWNDDRTVCVVLHADATSTRMAGGSNHRVSRVPAIIKKVGTTWTITTQPTVSTRGRRYIPGVRSVDQAEKRVLEWYQHRFARKT